MTLQDRILTTLTECAVTPRALYGQLDAPAEAIDCALLGLVRQRRAVLLHGHYQATTDARAAQRARAGAKDGKPRTPRLQIYLGEPLTLREEEIADLAADGVSRREMSARLGITTKTVSGHLSRIYAKLGVRGRKRLAEYVQARNAREAA